MKLPWDRGLLKYWVGWSAGSIAAFLRPRWSVGDPWHSGWFLVVVTVIFLIGWFVFKRSD